MQNTSIFSDALHNYYTNLFSSFLSSPFTPVANISTSSGKAADTAVGNPVKKFFNEYGGEALIIILGAIFIIGALLYSQKKLIVNVAKV